MGNPVVKFEGRYLVWSTVVDAPITCGMTREELEAWHRDEYGRIGAGESFERRVARIDEKGTSSLMGDRNANDTIWLNRAGPDGRPLHREEILAFYVRRSGPAFFPSTEEVAKMREGSVKCDPCIADDGNGGGRACKCWGSGVRYPGKDPV